MRRWRRRKLSFQVNFGLAGGFGMVFFGVVWFGRRNGVE